MSDTQEKISAIEESILARTMVNSFALSQLIKSVGKSEEIISSLDRVESMIIDLYSESQSRNQSKILRIRESVREDAINAFKGFLSSDQG